MQDESYTINELAKRAKKLQDEINDAGLGVKPPDGAQSGDPMTQINRLNRWIAWVALRTVQEDEDDGRALVGYLKAQRDRLRDELRAQVKK